jgi:hypothetical protein
MSKYFGTAIKTSLTMAQPLESNYRRAGPTTLKRAGYSVALISFQSLFFLGICTPLLFTAVSSPSLLKERAEPTTFLVCQAQLNLNNYHNTLKYL